MVTNINNPVKDALAKAKAEVEKEEVEKMVKSFKSKLKEVESAKRIVANLERELEEMELTLGNI